MGYDNLRGIIFKCFDAPGYFALIRAGPSIITVPALAGHSEAGQKFYSYLAR